MGKHKMDIMPFIDVAFEAIEQVQDEERKKVRAMMIEFKNWNPAQESLLDRCTREASDTARKINHSMTFLRGGGHEQGATDIRRVQG